MKVEETALLLFPCDGYWDGKRALFNSRKELDCICFENAYLIPKFCKILGPGFLGFEFVFFSISVSLTNYYWKKTAVT